MRFTCRLLLGALLTIPLCGMAAAADSPLPYAANLPQLAAASAKQGLPLILLVSLTDCKFCEKIRREHLAPLLKTGVPVWQIHLDTDGKVIGFNGQPITERQLARELKVRVAPTVMFFDTAGRQLAEPLVGTMLDDFYAAYLDDAIAEARKKLAARAP
jgi:thioredoxin-related protein